MRYAHPLCAPATASIVRTGEASAVGPTMAASSPHHKSPPFNPKKPLAPLKSNLKKPLTKEEQKQRGIKKVTWPDAQYGRDLAHVHEFHSSEMEEGELHGVKNSCVCAIQ